MAKYCYEDAFRNAIKDLQSFYKEEYYFTVKVRYGDNLWQHASIVGRNENSTIRFSKDCCDHPLTNSTELFVALLIVCHELAHYLNHHNYYDSFNDEENRIIEAWADNFGSKIFMVLITYGEKIKHMCEVFSVPSDAGDRINLIGSAFKNVCNMFYKNESRKYHYRIERMMHICAGISSFLQFYWRKVDLQLTLDVYRRLYNNSGMYDLIEADFDTFPISNDDFDKVIKIHHPLQNGNSAITLGLKKEYWGYIDTSFVEDITIVSQYRNAFSFIVEAQLEEGGYPDDFKKTMMEKLERKDI